tara:strand:+ start:900 stop:1388 length:489 start_codon:yes stop_codon:yes gene_type:complete
MNYFYYFIAFILLLYLICSINNQVVEYYNSTDETLQRVIKKCEPLFTTEYYNPTHLKTLKKLNNRNILNEIKILRGENSYTINKQKVYICLKDDNGKYYDDNMLIYVLLHELSHVICEEVGHTKKFHDIFEKLLERAVKLKIYDPKKELIFNYCKNGDKELL